MSKKTIWLFFSISAVCAVIMIISMVSLAVNLEILRVATNSMGARIFFSAISAFFAGLFCGIPVGRKKSQD